MPTPLVLLTSEIVEVDGPVATETGVQPLHIVAVAIPGPTLVNGRPT